MYTLSSRATGALRDDRQAAVHPNYLSWTYTYCLRHFTDGARTAMEADAAAERVGDLTQRAWAAHYAGMALRQVPDPEGALPYITRAAELFLRAGDDAGYPQTLAILGDCLCDLGRYAEAIDAHRTVVAWADDPASGMQPALRAITAGRGYRRLGDDHTALGDHEEALRMYRRSMGCGRPEVEAVAVHRAAISLRTLGRADEAREMFDRAAARCTEIGARDDAEQVRKDKG